jgi:hypothetical protein
MAWVGLVLGQLHALSRHATTDGKNDLNQPLTEIWAVPAARAVRPLLDWGNPDTVYLMYGKIWLPVFAAFTLCAFLLYRRRSPRGFEKWAWRVALTGYVLATLAVFVEYWLNWTGYGPLFEPAFMTLVIPGFLLTLIGSTVLGIALYRNRIRPFAIAWLLALTIPIAVVVLQFTSMGSAALPVMFAFAIAGRKVATEQDSPSPLRARHPSESTA